MIQHKQMTWEEAVLWFRQQPNNAEFARQCFYDDPVLAAAERYFSSSEWRAVHRELPTECGSALDVGAGRGISSYALAKEGWLVTALEPDPSEVVGSGEIRKLAIESGINLNVVTEWGEALPFPANSFDLVYCRAVLHHARDLRQLCKEIERVLKPSGYFIATREHVISKRSDIDLFLQSHPLHQLYGGESAYLLVEYESAIINSGLKLRKVFNPYESDINIFPETKLNIKKRISSKVKIIPSWLIPDFALALYGEHLSLPGRLYSFVATKDS